MLGHGSENLENLTVYSFSGLSTLKKATCSPTMTKLFSVEGLGFRVEGSLASGL